MGFEGRERVWKGASDETRTRVVVPLGIRKNECFVEKGG